MNPSPEIFEALAAVVAEGEDGPVEPKQKQGSPVAKVVALEAEPIDANPAQVEAPCTPADDRAVPEPDTLGRHRLRSPGYYLNRELGLLNFYFRVLHEAEDPRTPLLERLKFAAIVGNNLDEFTMKRIGGLKQVMAAGVQERSVDGRTPSEQVRDCFRLIRKLEKRQRKALRAIFAELGREGIEIVGLDDLTKKERKWVNRYYRESVHPLLTPQTTDPAHPFPFISNRSMNLLVTLADPSDGRETHARVKVPFGSGTDRFVALRGKQRYLPLASVIEANFDRLFPGMDILAVTHFRVTRNATGEHTEDSADDLLELLEAELRGRQFAPVVRVELSAGADASHRRVLMTELGLEPDDLFEADGLLGLGDLAYFTRIERPDLKYPPHYPVEHPELPSDVSVFTTLRERESLLLHHPYESFSATVERFLDEASHDPQVRAIKMTIYRTEEESQAVRSLIEAAQNGKQVTVVVELKASFDEAANIRWANRLEQAGIHVTYGVVGLKTHAKVLLVVRQDEDRIRRYAHLGTGNYHAETARLYTDLGLLTCDRKIGQDLTELFNYLTTGLRPRRPYKAVHTAPTMLKSSLLARIDREATLHSKKEPGHIQFKMNALEDPEIVRALYRAARKGVRIELLVRDTCRLRPGIRGLSENVTVVSVVGRLLEHSRIYYFRNGGDEEYFIASADCMSRNLNARVEVMAPVDDPDLQAEIRLILDTQLADHRGGWIMRADGSYQLRSTTADEAAVSSQQVLMRWAEHRARDAEDHRRGRPRGLGRGST